VFAGRIELDDAQVRVLGCLMEKQRTTPDAYPLSLNALRLACNQSTNRDPVVDYDEATIREALHRLERRGITRLASGAGSRTAKYRHLLAEVLPMDGAEQAVLCVLLLRGAQTPGELKQRAERMHPFADLAAVQQTLAKLIERGLAEQLPRRPGQKEERYRDLLGDGGEGAIATTGEALETAPAPAGAPHSAPNPQAPQAPRPPDALAALEARVEELERQLAQLRASLGNGHARSTAPVAADARGGVVQ
jgi:uncharacterized protein